jgi:hypothetical protein
MSTACKLSSEMIPMACSCSSSENSWNGSLALNLPKYIHKQNESRTYSKDRTTILKESISQGAESAQYFEHQTDELEKKQNH